MSGSLKSRSAPGCFPGDVRPGKPGRVHVSGRLTARALLELTKARLGLFIALSSAAGHTLAQDRLTRDTVLISLWVFLLSAGAGVINNIQDRFWDRGFARTRNRVLARGRLSPGAAGCMGAFLAGSGLIGLFFLNQNNISPALGLASLVCYNALYTPLKKKSLFAMVPGTLCGMLPPAIGWAAVPGRTAVADLSGLVLLMAGLGVWQVSHFLVIYLKQTNDCPFPGVWGALDRLDPVGLKYHIMVWTCLFSLTGILFLIRGWIVSPGLSLLVFTTLVFLPPVQGLGLCLMPLQRFATLSFQALNLSMLVFLGAGILDRV